MNTNHILKRNNILILTELFFPEEYAINDLALELDKEYNVTVLTRNPSYPKGEIYKNYKNIFYSKYNFKSINIVGLKFIKNYGKNLGLKILSNFLYVFQSIFYVILNRKKFDKVFYYQTGPLTNGICLLFFSKNTKISIWIQDLWPDTINIFTKNKLIKFVAHSISKIIYKKTDLFFISCEGFSDSLINNFKVKNENIFFTPNWTLNNFKINFKQNFNNQYINILYAGNIGKFQNLEHIIKGVIKSNNENIHLDILGDGSLKKYLLSKYGNFSKITFHNRVSVQETEKYFEKSDFLILSLVKNPLFNIMMPSKIQTYLSTNRPILSLVNGYTNNFIQKNKLGYVFDSENLNEFSSFLNKLNSIQNIDYNSFKENILNTSEIFLKKNIIKSICEKF